MPDGEVESGSFTGDGPVDAFFSALNAATGHEARLREYHVSAVTGGRDALGEVTVLLELGGELSSGVGRVDGHPRGLRQGLPARALERAGERRGRRGRAHARARGEENSDSLAASFTRGRVDGPHERTHSRRPLCPRPPRASHRRQRGGSGSRDRGKVTVDVQIKRFAVADRNIVARGVLTSRVEGAGQSQAARKRGHLCGGRPARTLPRPHAHPQRPPADLLGLRVDLSEVNLRIFAIRRVRAAASSGSLFCALSRSTIRLGRGAGAAHARGRARR